jgi:hypothetical protein
VSAARTPRIPLPDPPRVVNVGLDLFAGALAQVRAPVVGVDWRPPAGGDPKLAALLARLDGTRARIDAANRKAFDILVNGEPVLLDCRPAREAMELPDRIVLHSGPPHVWERVSPPVRAAILCAIRYENWAANDDAAAELVVKGEVRLEPCHHWRAVGPMAGVLTPSMPVFVVENRAHGNRAFVTINEGLGKVLRYGANDASVLARLHWIAQEAGPLFGAALRAAKGIELRPLMAQALRMGDEMHQRNVAASSLFLRTVMPHIARVGDRHHAVARLAEFLAPHDQFFLNLAMAAGKAMVDPARDVEGSTLVTTMARNGTEFGIRVAHFGDRWFTAPVEMPVGLYFPGYGPDDANPDMGDSAIVETIGLGGGAMAASPAVARFLGAGGVAEAFATTEAIREICHGEHPHFRIASLDERGAPAGIDVLRVVETGIAPIINTGIASKLPGVGQVGAGVVRAPLGCFTAALENLTSG